MLTEGRGGACTGYCLFLQLRGNVVWEGVLQSWVSAWKVPLAPITLSFRATAFVTCVPPARPWRRLQEGLSPYQRRQRELERRREMLRAA